MKPIRQRLLISGLPYLAIAGVMCLACLRLITMRYWVHWDMLEEHFPFYLYASDVFASGGIPLWNPFQDCGTAFFSNLQSQIWYPIHQLIYWTVGYSFTTLQYEFILHLFLAGCGIYILARRLQLEMSGATLCGISYMLSGFFVSHAEHQSWVIAYTWIPWLLAGVHGMLTTDRRRYFFEITVVGASLFLAGYQGIILAAGLYFLIYVLYRLRSQHKQKINFSVQLGNIAWLILALLLIVGLSAIHYIPAVMEFGEYTTRHSGLPFEEAVSNNALPLPALVTLFLPAVSVAVNEQRQVFGIDLSMVNIYFGILALSLAVYAIIRRVHPDTLIFFILGFASLLMAFGEQCLLRPLSYEFLPLFDSFRNSSLFSGLFIMSFCILAGMGLDGLVHAEDRDIKLMRKALITALCISITVFLLVIAWYLRWIKADPQTAEAIHTAFLNGLPVQILILFLAVIALSVSIKKRAHLALLLLGIAALDSALMVQTNFYSVAERPGPELERFVKDYLPKRPRSVPLISNISSVRENNWDQYDSFGMVRKVFQTGNHTPSRNYTYVALLEGGFHETLARPPRYFLSPGVYVETDQERAFEIITQAPASDAMPVIMDQVQPGLAILNQPYLPRESLLKGAPRIVEYGFNKVVLNVRAPGPVLLGSTETYHRGWKALLNGEPVEVLKFNGAFRAIAIPGPGEYQVEFSFEPASFKWGAAISIISLILLIAFAGWSIVRWRKLT